MEPDLEAGSSTTPDAPAVASIKFETVFPYIVAVIITTVLAGVVFYPHDTLLPTFSVDVAGLDGLDGPRPAATVNATFELTLHGVTRQRRVGNTLGICQERGTVAVSYAGAVLAWGRVPKFCVPEQGEEHVKVVALGDDVGLSDELRDRMATERLSRVAELDVDMMLDRSRMLSCRVKLDQPSPQPSPCKVFTLSYIPT